MKDLWIAIGLTTLAGMATAIGSVLAFAVRRTNRRFLAVATGFSAGVMLYVSFVEILAKGAQALAQRFGEPTGNWINAGSFFGGMLLIGLIDNLIPSGENPHEVRSDSVTEELKAQANSDQGPAPVQGPTAAQPLHDRRLLRMGLFTALAIAIHNFPEGLATFLAALEDPKLGLAIAVAIALHNIPEGISVSVPIYYATGSRRKAFLYSALSGLAEPIGAAAGLLLIRSLFGGGASAVPPEAMGVLFGGVAGIMVYISLDELLPTSRAYGRGHDSLFGLVGGMGLMALSLLLMQ
ncbi:MAG: zinc transporter ZupT [Fimbriimonadaceae bacterium]